VDDEPLLLKKVDVRWSAVRALGRVDVGPPHLVGRAGIAPDPHPAPRQNVLAVHSLER
jgi:hypothetical protein